jgi:hypothetical protein
VSLPVVLLPVVSSAGDSFVLADDSDEPEPLDAEPLVAEPLVVEPLVAEPLDTASVACPSALETLLCAVDAVSFASVPA